MKKKIITLSAILFLGATGDAFSQGTAFTYQGRLNDTGGPVNGTYDLRFVLYNASIGGAQQGPILTNSAVPVSAGLFNVALDFGAGVFSGAERWLDISVRTNGNGGFTPLSSRQQLTATPYAITASNLSGVLPSTGLAGTYSSAVTLNNAANALGGSGANLTGLNASQLTSGTVSDARLSTNVALRLGGNTFSGDQTFTNGNIYLPNNQAIYARNTGGTPEVFLWPRYADNATYLNFGSGGFHIRNFLDVPVMTMRTNGNVGIGTTLPDYPLSFPNSLGDKISLYGGLGNHFGFGIQSFQMQIHTDTSAADIVFGYGQSTNLTEKMRIKGTGSVGIGTANPAANTLQINTNFHLANGYGLQVNKSDYGANIQINRGSGQSGIGLVVDNSGDGDANTSVLLVRNNAGTSAENLLNVRADGNSFFSGNVTASGTISGIGSGLTSLNASSLGSGTVADVRLSSNVALRSGGNTFSGNQTITGGNLYFDNAQFILAKNTLGAYENFLWPRWSDNITYLNYGSNGFNIRNNASIPTMFMQNDGKVGIATTTPSKTLQVGGPFGTEGMISLGSSGSGGARSWDIGVPKGDVSSDGKFYSFVIDDLGFGTDPEFMIKWGTGKVGIGTTNPAANLHVVNSSGVGVFVGNRTPFGGAAFETDYTTAAQHAYFAENGTNVFNVAGGGSGYFKGGLTVGGTLGIGSGNQQLNLNAAFSDATMTIKQRPGDNFPLYVVDSGGGEYFKLQSVFGKALYLYGTPYNTVSIFWTTFSDERLKQDVKAHEAGLNELLQLRTIRYRYKDDAKRGLSSKQAHTGVVAQEVQKVFPDAVLTDGEGYLSVQADSIFWASIHAIQELNQKVEERDAKISQLEKRLSQMEKAIQALTTTK